MRECERKYNWPKIISVAAVTALLLPIVLMYIVPLVLVSAVLDRLRGWSTWPAN